MDALTDRKALQLLATQKAIVMWASFDKNERAGVRFGMFPAKKMQAAMKEGHDSRMLSVALMDCASKDGGMRA